MTSKLNPSRSAPSLVQAAGFNLREFSLNRKKIVTEKPSLASMNAPSPERLGEIDLIGGNGHWRQRLAEHEFERRREEAKAQKEEAERLERERRARQKRREERMRRQQEEEERKRADEAERKRLIQEERERAERERAEKDRLRREEEERAWQQRQPKTCLTCEGTGVCQACQGKGVVFGMFLVESVGGKFEEQKGKDMGKLTQGCSGCGGLWQGVRGEVATGSGICLQCAGSGKIWPKPTLTRKTTKRDLVGLDA